MRRWPSSAAEPPQPAVARRRVGVGAAEVVERLDDAAALGRRLDGAPSPSLGPERAPRVDERAGPRLERGEVARADPPAGTGEQPAERVAGGRVDQHGERGDDVGDLGHLEQPAEPDDLDRQAALAQRGGDAGQLLAGAHQHRDRRALAVACRPNCGSVPCQQAASRSASASVSSATVS